MGGFGVKQVMDQGQTQARRWGKRAIATVMGVCLSLCLLSNSLLMLGTGNWAIAAEIPIPRVSAPFLSASNDSPATHSVSPNPASPNSASPNSANSTGSGLVPLYPYPPSVWQKFEEVRQDPRLEQLIQQDIENSLVLRQIVRDEVDHSFSFTTTLLNVLLALLGASPIFVGAGFWFLRRSVVNQVRAQTQQQLQEEVERQLGDEVTNEIKRQTDIFKLELEMLREEFLDKLAEVKGLASEAEKAKNSIIGELAEILPLPLREDDNPELHERVKTLTQQLTALKTVNKQLNFSAADYVEQGKALHYEQSYEDALTLLEKARELDPQMSHAAWIQALTLAKLQRFEAALSVYDEALTLSPDSAVIWYQKALVLSRMKEYEAAVSIFDKAISLRDGYYQAWFGKARAHGWLKQREQALVALKQAIALEGDRCRDVARTEPAFDGLQALDEFKQLVAAA